MQPRGQRQARPFEGLLLTGPVQRRKRPGAAHTEELGPGKSKGRVKELIRVGLTGLEPSRNSWRDPRDHVRDPKAKGAFWK